MAITPTIYGLFLESLVEGRVDVRSDDMYMMLVTNTYVFNQNTHKFKSVVTGEVVGSGYAAGGKQVTGLVPSYSSVSKILSLPAGNMQWNPVTISGVTGAVLYMKPDGAPTNAMPLVGYLNFNGSVSRDGTALYINWAATGACKLAVP